MISGRTIPAIDFTQPVCGSGGEDDDDNDNDEEEVDVCCCFLAPCELKDNWTWRAGRPSVRPNRNGIKQVPTYYLIASESWYNKN